MKFAPLSCPGRSSETRAESYPNKLPCPGSPPPRRRGFASDAGTPGAVVSSAAVDGCSARARTRRRERLAVATLRLAAGLRANVDAHRSRIGRQRERVAVLFERAQRATPLIVRQRAASLERCGQLLAALSHRAVLARGFALVRDLDGRPLRVALAVAAGQRIDIEFSDGRVRARAEQPSAAALDATAPSEPASDVPAKPRRRGGGEPGQGSLFG